AVCELFERGVFQITQPKTENAEEHAAFRFLFDQPNQVSLVCDTDIEVTIPGKDHSIRSTRDVVRCRKAVCELNARRTIRRTARFEIVERAENVILPVARRWRKNHSGCSRINNHRYAIVLSQLLREHLHCSLQQWELLRRLHRAGHIDKKNQIARWPPVQIEILALDAYTNQPMLRTPRSGCTYHLRKNRIRP